MNARLLRPSLLAALASVALIACGDSSSETSDASDSAASSAVTISGGTTAGSDTQGATQGATDPTSGGTDSATGTTAGTSSPTATDPETSATDSTGDPTTQTTTPATETGIDPGPFCGDGVLDVDLGEECDDGDNIDNNACSNECTMVPCEEQQGGGNAVLSYIWIANSSQGTVSKINTESAIEEARYYVEGGQPSRTSVNLRGDVAVSSRDPGGVTKIAAKVEDCVDKNNNGMIETSQGPNDLLPAGTDECVLWQKPIPSPGYSYGPRATAWVAGDPDPVTCEYPEPVLWMGWKDNGNTAHFLKIDGATGDTIDEVLHPWGSEYSPYGGAVDADGNF